MSLGERIKEFRESRGLSQETFSEKLGVTRQTVSKWENDTAMPNRDNLCVVGELLNISLDEIFGVIGATDTIEKRWEEAEAYSQHVRRRKRIKDVGHVFTAMLILGISTAIALLWFRVDKLSTAVENSILGQKVQLVSSFNLAIRNYSNSAKQKVTLDLSLLPTQKIEGLTVAFQISRAGVMPVVVEAYCEKGTTDYHASANLSGYIIGYTVSAIFSDGERQYTQVLAENLSIAGLATGGTSVSWDPVFNN